MIKTFFALSGWCQEFEPLISCGGRTVKSEGSMLVVFCNRFVTKSSTKLTMIQPIGTKECSSLYSLALSSGVKISLFVQTKPAHSSAFLQKLSSKQLPYCAWIAQNGICPLAALLVNTSHACCAKTARFKHNSIPKDNLKVGCNAAILSTMLPMPLPMSTKVWFGKESWSSARFSVYNLHKSWQRGEVASPYPREPGLWPLKPRSHEDVGP